MYMWYRRMFSYQLPPTSFLFFQICSIWCLSRGGLSQSTRRSIHVDWEVGGPWRVVGRELITSFHKTYQTVFQEWKGEFLYNLHFLVSFHNIKGDSDRCSSLKVIGLKKLSSWVIDQPPLPNRQIRVSTNWRDNQTREKIGVKLCKTAFMEGHLWGVKEE